MTVNLLQLNDKNNDTQKVHLAIPSSIVDALDQVPMFLSVIGKLACIAHDEIAMAAADHPTGPSRYKAKAAMSAAAWNFDQITKLIRLATDQAAKLAEIKSVTLHGEKA